MSTEFLYGLELGALFTFVIQVVIILIYHMHKAMGKAGKYD